MSDHYKPFETFLLRSPALPFDYRELIEPDFFHDTFFKEAIYIASSELSDEMEKYRKGYIISEKDKGKINDSLYKYWKRIRTRTTPYGLFSSVSAGTIGAGDTQVLFSGGLRKNARLDMEVLCSLIHSLEQDNVIGQEILYFPNDTLYKVLDRIRYFEKDFAKNRFFRYAIASVMYSSYLKKVIRYCGKGCTMGELVLYIREIEKDVSREEAIAFIRELIGANLLISELTPCLTGTDILDKTISVLESRHTKSPKLHTLRDIRKKLDEINNERDSRDNYQHIIRHLDELNITYSKKNVFQIDLYRETEKAVLNEKTVQDILSAILFVTRLAPVKRKSEALETFKKVFTEKYEERELDLLFVTDADTGIGYPVNYSGGPYTNDLIKGLSLPQNRQAESRISWNPFQELLLKKIIEASRENTSEIVLNDEDIVSAEPAGLYPTFHCNFEIVGNDGNCPILKLNSFGDHSGANLMARFSHTHTDIEKTVRSITQKEQESESRPILEIVHLTNPRIGNVVIRPQMRNYELTILSVSGLPEARKIPVSDLTISVKNGAVLLKSRKLNREVKAVHTNAFNHNLSTIPVFNLLCDLQYDNGCIEGAALHPNITVPFVPRVKYKNVILSPATWYFTRKELEYYFKDQSQGLSEQTDRWRKKYGIPRYVLFAEGDNELFLDLEDDRNIDSMPALIRKNNAMTFKEFLFDDQCGIVKDSEGKIYRNEFSIAYYKV